jgi:hypothetical protein
MVRYPTYQEPHYPQNADAEMGAGYVPVDDYGAIDEPVVDFAFADTVVAADLDNLDESVPPSQILVNDETGHAHHLVPIAYPPASPADPGVTTRMRFAWARVRHDVKDMHQLWDATASDRVADQGMVDMGRRVRALVSFFEWDRADLLRAAWIGLAVLVFVATFSAIVMQVGAPVM